MPATHILVVEDDQETADIIVRGLEAQDYSVVHCIDGESASKAVTDSGPDLLILDRMLPGMDGLGLLESFRSRGIDVPVLMLTALGRIEDRVAGLNAGADDYLVKPFAVSELVARVNALLRRRQEVNPATHLQSGNLVLDVLERSVTRDGKPVALQPREFRLLEALVRNAGKIVTRKMLLEQVWGFHFDPQTNIVETHMSRMRSKLNDGFENDLVETVRGEGYRLRDDD